jgi:hypothetical protein
LAAAASGGAGARLMGTKRRSARVPAHGGAGLLGARNERRKDGAGGAGLPVRAAAAHATRNMLKE